MCKVSVRSVLLGGTASMLLLGVIIMVIVATGATEKKAEARPFVLEDLSKLDIRISTRESVGVSCSIPAQAVAVVRLEYLDGDKWILILQGNGSITGNLSKKEYEGKKLRFHVTFFDASGNVLTYRNEPVQIE